MVVHPVDAAPSVHLNDSGELIKDSAILLACDCYLHPPPFLPTINLMCSVYREAPKLRWRTCSRKLCLARAVLLEGELITNSVLMNKPLVTREMKRCIALVCGTYTSARGLWCLAAVNCLNQ